MKKILLIPIAVFTLFSCSKDSDDGGAATPSKSSEEKYTQSSKTVKEAKEKVKQIKELSDDMMEGLSSMRLARLAEDSSGAELDFNICELLEVFSEMQSENPSEEETCAVTTFGCTNNEQDLLISIDYGTEGCEDEDEESGESVLMVGKLTMTISLAALENENANSFSAGFTFENFGEKGGDLTSGTGTMSVIGGEVSVLTQMVEMDLELVTEGETLDIKFNDVTTGSDFEFTSNYSITATSSDNYIVSLVSTSAVKSIMCSSEIQPVSGTEEVKLTEGTEITSLEVDYGNGDCDGVYTIIADGNSSDYSLTTDEPIAQ